MLKEQLHENECIKKIRRVYPKEFCPLAGADGAIFYRPQVEVLRMLTAGEAWCIEQNEAWLMQALVPIIANVAVAGAFRELLKDASAMRACLVLPPVGFINVKKSHVLLQNMLLKLIEIAWRRAPYAEIWAVLEYNETALQMLAVYFDLGFELIALRPMVGVSPCYVLHKKTPKTQIKNQELKVQNIGEETCEKLLVSTAETTRLALLLERGWEAKAMEEDFNESFFVLCNTKL